MQLKMPFRFHYQIFYLFVIVILVAGYKNYPANSEDDKKQIASTLDSFNLAAGRADYAGYFNYYTSDAIFIGTDPTERWDKQQFMVWAKKYFDRGKAWNFKSIDRHIYIGENKNIAWFDELLNTQMKICRGSGVVVKRDGVWKIQQYVLSITMPNDQIDGAIKLKAHMEDSIINSLIKK
jgi:SnoaL-like domain